MIKVAYLGIKGLPSKGGAERVVEAIVGQLASQIQPTVYCGRDYTPADYRALPVRLIRLPTLPGKHLRPLSLFVLSALHALLRGDYDVVHLHNAEACFMAPLLRLRFRVLATSHGQAYARGKWGPGARFLISLSDYFFIRVPHAVTSVSHPLARLYRSRYGREVRYLPNGVDRYPVTDVPAARATLSAHGVQGPYLIFVAGRIDPTKGCHLLIEAFQRVQTDWPLVVVGDSGTVPAYGEELRRLADSRVRFIPFVASKAEILGLMEQAQLLIFPSLVEAMSMVLLEAASLGVPLVASDIPENTSILKEPHCLYFRSGEVGDLAQKLVYALAHPAAMQARGQAARLWVQRRFSWETIAGQYAELYRELLAGSGGAEVRPCGN